MKWMVRIGLGLAVILIMVAAAAYLSLTQGWVFPKHSQAELTDLTAPYDTWVYPDGAGPFPLVITAHGCGGRAGFMDEWAAVLRDAGFAVLITDSFRGRDLHSQEGIDTVCGGRALLGPERAADLYVALNRALDNDRIDPARIGLMGFSHGGWTVMELLGTVPPYGIDAPIMRDGAPLDLSGVKASALIYPYCGFGAALNGVSHTAPILLELAEADEIADHTECLDLSKSIGAGGVPVSVHVAPGAVHAYDKPQWTFAGENENFRPDLRRSLERRVVAFFKANL